MMKKVTAEFIGTFWLVLGGCGSAVLAAAFPQVGIGLLGVALAFGLTVLTIVYSLGHIEYAADRLKWLYDHRTLVGGLKFVEEPPVLRFFFGRMNAIGDWGQKLMEAYIKDFGNI